MEFEFTPKEWLALAGALLAMVAAFLPWRATPGVTVTGIEGLGVVTLVLGGLAGGAVLLATWSEQGAVAAALGGALVTLISAYTLVTISGAVSPGIGLYLTVLGGLGLCVAGAWGLVAGERPGAFGE